MTASKGAAPFDIVEIDAADVASRPDALRDIYERRIDGLIVHNVYQPDEVALLERRIGDRTMQRVGMDWGTTIGRVLVRSEADDYHRTAARFRDECSELFRGMVDLETRFEQLAGQMSGDRPVEVPHNNGATYSPFTIRIMEPGEDLPLHCGNQFLHELEAFRHLSTLLDPKDQLSYFLTIAEAEQGGELILYQLEWPGLPEMVIDGEPRCKLGRYKRQPHRPPAGSMLVFDGGRIWHRVSRTDGARARITAGGFAAFTRDHGRICYWS